MNIPPPDYVICLECESPCYTFDWDEKQGRVTDILCAVCGNDKRDDFQTEEEFIGEE